MKKAPIPKNEKERLRALYALNLLDTAPEDRFDRITRLATRIFNVPISTLTLVDVKREWFKSCQGLPEREGDRAISFCGHALDEKEILVVPDTLKDPRFSDNPMVIGKPFIRFYAGVPIESVDGQKIGVFCIKDIKPRVFSKKEEEILKGLATWTEREIDTRNFYLMNQAVFASMGEGLVVIDREGKIILMNKTAAATLRLEESGVLRKHYNEVWQMQDEKGNILPLKKRPLQVSLTGGKKISTADNSQVAYWCVRGDNTKFPVAFNITPLMLDGRIAGAVLIFQDITHEKELEKLRVDFLSLASHQLRTPLSGVKWLLETLQRGVIGKLNQKQKAYLDDVYRVNERMIKIVFDMLSALRLEAEVTRIKKEKILVPDFYKKLIAFTESAAKSKNVILHNAWKNHKSVVIETDSQIIRSILECFISNAIDYSLSRQKIILDAKEEAGAIVFSVKDSGIGIPKEEQKQIFERFYRASNAKKAKPEGTGLGLYLAAMLAEKIKAKISFESKEGMGATFYLRVSKKVK